jgi:LPXTG-site transpeptidase (sortase) family protein
MSFRGVLGYSLFFAGGALMAFAGGRYAVGEWQRQDARRLWDEAEARAIVALARQTASVDERNPAAIIRGAPIARLLIPRLGVDEIVLEGVDDNTLNAGPGHLPGSVYPGERGNSVISAHRDRHFARLGEIKVGDTLVTEGSAHRGRERWVVISRRVIAANAPALFHTREAMLTLTTCWPIRYLGTAPERLVVSAIPIGPVETPSFANASAT